MFASAERVELAQLWDELTTGGCKVQSWSHTRDSWSLTVTREPSQVGERHSAPRKRDLEILEQALLCGARKLVAVEAGLSCSSIALILHSCFDFMGIHCLPSRIPGLLVAAAHAKHHPETALQSRSQARKDRKFALQTIRVPRPDSELVAWLAPAEHAVVHLLVEGLTYAEIARVRETSVRTVANQVASGFRRLGVSGRAELLCLLSRWSLEATTSPTQRPLSLPPLPASPSRAAQAVRLRNGAVNGRHWPSPSLAT